jgi:outer membrane protein assembly factor BamE
MRSTLPQTARTVRPPRAATLLLCLAALLGAGCVYRMPVQQGNLLDPMQVTQLEEGMTRTQVSFLLGTPMVPPGFDDSRWDYYYYVKIPRLKEPLTRRLTVFFENDKVVRFEKVGIPDVPKAATAPDAVNPGALKVEPPKNISPTEAPRTVARPEVSDGGNAAAPGAAAGSTSERLDK